jgi:hypothetical protein
LTTFNHEANYIPPDGAPLVAANGFVHYIGGVLGLPNSTAHAIRTRPQLSTLQRALRRTEMAERLYDTNAHISQTIFAPTNAAFERVGKTAKRFLFSRAGRPYLDAILRFHVVENQTMFSDMYWPHGGAALVDLNLLEESEKEVSNSNSKAHGIVDALTVSSSICQHFSKVKISRFRVTKLTANGNCVYISARWTPVMTALMCHFQIS